jgi:hypothetical protein
MQLSELKNDINPANLLTIVIPTRKRASEFKVVLGQVITYLEEMDSPPIQVVVSNNGSDQATRIAVESLKNNKLTQPIIYLETPTPFETAEQHLQWLYTLKFGEFVWFLGDQDVPTKTGFSNAVEVLKNSKKNYAFYLFNFETFRNGKLVCDNYFGPDLSTDREVNFIEAVQNYGYWAGICGISNQILRSSEISSEVFQIIINDCGPIYSHMTHHLHQFGNQEGLIVRTPLVQYALNDLSDGDESGWRKYASKMRKPYFDPWLLGFLKQIEFLDKRNVITKTFLENVLDYEVGLKSIPEVIPLSTRIKFSLESYLYQSSSKRERSYGNSDTSELKELLNKHLPNMKKNWENIELQNHKVSLPTHYVWGAFDQYFTMEYKNYTFFQVNSEYFAIFKPKRELFRYAIKNSTFLCSVHFKRSADLNEILQVIDAENPKIVCKCNKDIYHKTAYIRVPRVLILFLASPYYRLPLKVRKFVRKYLS